MSEVKWIKIATDIFDDEKVLLIESMPDADAIIVIWLKLLVFAGKQNNNGVLKMGALPYTDEMLAAIFRRPLQTVRLALGTFERFGMIEIYDDVITIPNWEKHQSLDKLERFAQQNRDRVKRHREKQKALAACNGNVTLQLTQSNAPDTDTDKDKELNSSGYTDIWKAITTDQIDYIMETYVEGSNLIQEVYEQVKYKRKTVAKPFEYIIGYAEKKQWSKLRA